MKITNNSKEVTAKPTWWWLSKFDDNGRQIHYENSYGYKLLREYDLKGKQIYYKFISGQPNIKN